MQTTTWNRERWDNPEAWAAEWNAGYAWGPRASVWRDFLRFVAPLLPQGRAARILEIACGMGRFTELLLTVAEHVHAIDLAAHCVESCRERFSERFTVSQTDGQTLPEGTYDLIVSYDSLVHAECNVLAAYLSQAPSRLVDGGYVALHHANRPDRECSRTAVTSGMIFDLIADEPRLEMISQTLFRVRGRHFLDCFTVARKTSGAAEVAGG